MSALPDAELPLTGDPIRDAARAGALADAKARANTPAGRRTVTWGALGELLVHLAATTKDGVTALLSPRDARLDALEARVVALESRPIGASYKGTWNATATYAVNELITDHGSLWIARSASIGTRPGTAACWQMCAKRGADGRDGKDATR